MYIIAGFKNRANFSYPFVNSAFSAFYAFISPMGGKSVFCYSVHTFCTYLYFHPFVLRSENCDVQTFVTIAFGHAQPIAQSFWIRLIHIGNNTINLPTFLFFLFCRTVYNNPNGKQIIHAFEATALAFHFLPYGMNAFCAPFDMEF